MHLAREEGAACLGLPGAWRLAKSQEALGLLPAAPRTVHPSPSILRRRQEVLFEGVGLREVHSFCSGHFVTGQGLPAVTLQVTGLLAIALRGGARRQEAALGAG